MIEFERTGSSASRQNARDCLERDKAEIVEVSRARREGVVGKRKTKACNRGLGTRIATSGSPVLILLLRTDARVRRIGDLARSSIGEGVASGGNSKGANGASAAICSSRRRCSGSADQLQARSSEVSLSTQ
jgi:hypothetical protein